jgi:hypothetical protein
MPDDSKLAIDDSMSQIVEDDTAVFSNSIRTAGMITKFNPKISTNTADID